MRLLFDTNVILDVLLAREPFVGTAAELMSRVETGELSGFVGATTVTTIHYLATKAVGKTRAREEVRKLLSILEVATVNRAVLEEAVESDVADFKDAVLCAAARQADAQGIVTRNLEDFRVAPIRVYSPDETSPPPGIPLEPVVRRRPRQTFVRGEVDERNHQNGCSGFTSRTMRLARSPNRRRSNRFHRAPVGTSRPASAP